MLFSRYPPIRPLWIPFFLRINEMKYDFKNRPMSLVNRGALGGYDNVVPLLLVSYGGDGNPDTTSLIGPRGHRHVSSHWVG